jgi:hypothetical protein
LGREKKSKKLKKEKLQKMHEEKKRQFSWSYALKYEKYRLLIESIIA